MGGVEAARLYPEPRTEIGGSKKVLLVEDLIDQSFKVLATIATMEVEATYL